MGTAVVDSPPLHYTLLVDWNSLDPKDYKRAVSELTDGDKLDLSTVKPHPMFGDVRVRRALSKAISAERMMKDLLISQVTGEVKDVRTWIDTGAE